MTGMLERLREELDRKRAAGVDLSSLTLWFHPRTWEKVLEDCGRWRLDLLGVADCKQSDRVTLGCACVTMDEDVLIEWQLQR